MTRTPFIKLPPIYYDQNWHFDDTHKKMLEPNLHHFQHQPPPPPQQQQQQLPLILSGGKGNNEEDGSDDDDEVSKNDAGSPISSYSSSSSVSSFSSVNSVSLNHVNRKGSLASILNSDPELLALEREERLGGYQTYFNANNNGADVNNKNAADKNTATKKKRNAPDTTLLVDAKRQRRSPQQQQDRQIKGLRLFSKQVCNKVAEKGITTYNEVADELAADIQRNSASYDQKNIRRRVYDALNVFMALDIITKDRKEIKWLGLNNDRSFLEEQIQQEESRQRQLSQTIADTKSKLDDTFKQYLCLEKVVQRNSSCPSLSKVISFPFFVVSSDNSTKITRMSNHESCLSFTENASMMIYRDLEILSHIWRT